MAKCDCCHKNPGKVREYQSISVGTQGDVRKRIPSKTLCDTCNDGQYPHYEPTPDGGSLLTCPHNV
jgi:hypothetical protein